MTRPLLHPRDEIMQTMEWIYRYRMTTTSGGNLSIREPGGEIWITPARVDKGLLRRDDIVCVRPDGSVDGPHPPSSELPFHRAIYEARTYLHGIVHGHPVALVAFSIVGQTPDTRLFHQARNVCGPVGFCRLSFLACRIGGVFLERLGGGLRRRRPRDHLSLRRRRRLLSPGFRESVRSFRSIAADGRS